MENRMVIVKCLCECQALSYIPDTTADYKATVTRQCGVSAPWTRGQQEHEHRPTQTRSPGEWHI